MTLKRPKPEQDDAEPQRPDYISEGGTKPRVPRPSQWASVMEELIEEAMRSGAFDNLPGKGKPLELSRNPYGADTELAYQLLNGDHYARRI